jgi:hypothetical protein
MQNPVYILPVHILWRLQPVPCGEPVLVSLGGYVSSLHVAPARLHHRAPRTRRAKPPTCTGSIQVCLINEVTA